MRRIVAVNTLAYHGYKLEEVFSNISKTGARYIEPVFIKPYYKELTEEYFSLSNAKTIKHMIDDEGLSVYAIAAHMDLGFKNSVDMFRKRMDFATTIGASIINTNATKRENEIIFYSNIERIAKYAEELDLYVGLENPGAGENNIFGTAKEGTKVIEKIGSERIKINYDFANVYMYSRATVKPEEDFKFTLPSIIHFHLKDIIKYEDGFYLTRIGTGIINYELISEELKKQKIILPMSIELPLRFKWDLKYNFISDKLQDPPPINYINDVISESLNYIEKHF